MKHRILIPNLILLSLSLAPRTWPQSPDEALYQQRQDLEASSKALAQQAQELQAQNIVIDESRRKVDAEKARTDAVASDLVAFQSVAGGSQVYDSRTHNFISSFTQSARPLIVASGTIEPTKLAEMQEDLSVMAKLIDDNLADQRDPANPLVMGIRVTGSSDGAASRAMYIEGNGALFQIAVRFPLRSSEKKTSTPAQPSTKKTPWDEARHELYGGRDEPATAWSGSTEGKAEEYSEEKVEALKQGIFKALANANNFRHLGRDETVTVVARSGNTGVSRMTVTPKVSTSNSGGSWSVAGSSSGSTVRRWAGGTEPTTMTVRIKKSDADALAGGKITDDEFRKRAVVTVY